MSVYTRVSRQRLREYLREYEIGELVACEGISGGIENTNYFVDTTAGRYVLTLVEQWPAREVDYFPRLMAWLHAREVPCARPVAGRDGAFTRTLEGRAAVLVERLPGASITDPGNDERRAVGRMLAGMHLAGRGFCLRRNDGRGPAWRDTTAARVLPRLPRERARLLRDELAFQRERDTQALPCGVIHADLFRDNVLFTGTTISGVIDFYYACDGRLAYDLAVTVNDWCSRPDGTLDEESCACLLAAYESSRALRDEERHHWFAMLRAAALRYWLSRLHDRLFPREGVLITVKDPAELEAILEHRREGR
ncbi:MAG: homoserine kinase [Gammaproteobacteria bacterium]|nr:homoserine kinase [Gammaproteobacteria bacterium]